MLIEQLYNTTDFSNAEKAIANYIINNSETALRMTLQELANAAYVSKPTIIRFYRKLGVESFSDFRIIFYSELATEKEKLKDIDPNQPFQKQDSYQGVAQRLCELSVQTIVNCYLMLNSKNLENIVSLLTKSSHIYIYAIGDSFIRARSFQNKLIKIDKHVCLVNEMHEAETHFYNAKICDCAIFLSFSGNLLKQYSTHAVLLRERGVKTVLISACTKPEYTQLFDYVLKLDKGEDSYLKIATFSSQIGMDYLLNVLYSCIFEEDYDRYINRTKESYEYLKAHGLL